jgi:HEAT repeat protein
MEGDGVPAGGVVGRIADLAHDNQQIRWAAARGLKELGPEAAHAAPALIEVLADDPAWEVRKSAAEALGALGPEAKPLAIPTLKEAAEDDDEPQVRAAAKAAIEALNAPPKPKTEPESD